MTAAQRLVTRWQQHGVSLNPPASDADLRDLRLLLGCHLPDDIRELYALANGMPDLTYDDHQVSFWSIPKIATALHTWADGRLGFADVLINSWRFVYEVRDGHVAVVSENVVRGRSMQNIGTFDQFLEAYLADPSRLVLV